MSETGTSTQGGNTTSGTTPDAGDGFKPITSQDELNRIIGERVKRAKPADYDELRTKAGRLDEIEQANKSEIDKANERATKAEAEAAKVPSLVAGQLREHLVKLHKIEADDAELFLTATDPELLLKQVERLLAQGSQRKKTGNMVTREGTTQHHDKTNSDMREFTRNLFGSVVD
ncbi:hypothetical protein AB0B39_23620 [Micromonospora sp. NPDC049114]|uniref:hypothetical protein n=1 Tax=Micromonospora sp. NPDC049114 TaxID=3155498 RepID=UPI0033F07D92